jgi:hypothetical protein
MKVNDHPGRQRFQMSRFQVTELEEGFLPDRMARRLRFMNPTTKSIGFGLEQM